MTKAVALNCPHCGQLLVGTRFGVKLGPIQTRIVDIIKRAGLDGITRAELTRIIYGQIRVTTVVSVHVHNINSLLEGTDYRIGNVNKVYRIVRVSNEDKAA